MTAGPTANAQPVRRAAWHLPAGGRHLDRLPPSCEVETGSISAPAGARSPNPAQLITRRLGVTRQPTFAELFADCRRSAVHLEMRDAYTPDDPAFIDWKAGRPIHSYPEDREWRQLVRATVARGVRIRRARVVSEPVTDYIRFEWEVTADHNVAAGEQVRWLPRERASDLLLPGNDYWVFDDRLVRFAHFAGDGTIRRRELTDDPAIVRKCAAAFEAVWERAVDHHEYEPPWTGGTHSGRDHGRHPTSLQPVQR